MRPLLIVSTVCLTAALGCYGQDQDRDRGNYVQSIPAGTRIRVRTEQPIDVRDYSDGRIYRGTVAEDVVDPSNRLLIPRGADVEMIVQNVGEHEVAIDLDALSFEGRRYMVNAETYRRSRRAGVGANERTGKYVGGGALFGTILGAIAGGGKGAAIGALAGAAAGGGAEMATRGHEVHIPPESILTFHLEDPLQVATGRYSRDNGYDENGYHYHDGYYDRGGGRQ